MQWFVSYRHVTKDCKVLYNATCTDDQLLVSRSSFSFIRLPRSGPGITRSTGLVLTVPRSGTSDIFNDIPIVRRTRLVLSMRIVPARTGVGIPIGLHLSSEMTRQDPLAQISETQCGATKTVPAFLTSRPFSREHFLIVLVLGYDPVR